MKEYYVYMYYDPETSIPFYIGKGRGYRYRDISSRKINKRLYNKIQNIRTKYNCNVDKFVQIVFENLTCQQALKKEIQTIKKIGRKDLGKGPLLNLTDGGDGVINTSKSIIGKIERSPSRFIQKVKNGATIKELATLFKCSPNTIVRIGQRLKLTFQGRKVKIPAKEVLKIYKETKSLSYISKKYNCDRDVIIRILKENNINIEDGRLKSLYRGGRGTSKLSDYKQDIIDQYNKHISIHSISRQYKVSDCAVCNILKQNNIEIVRLGERKRKKAEIYTDKIIQMYNDTYSTKQIANKFNTSVYIIQQILRQNNIFLYNRNKGKNNYDSTR